MILIERTAAARPAAPQTNHAPPLLGTAGSIIVCLTGLAAEDLMPDRTRQGYEYPAYRHQQAPNQPRARR